MLITGQQQTISESTTALKTYANQDNCAETAAWGNKKKNRLLGEENGVDVEASVLHKLKK